MIGRLAMKLEIVPKYGYVSNYINIIKKKQLKIKDLLDKSLEAKNFIRHDVKVDGIKHTTKFDEDLLNEIILPLTTAKDKFPFE